MAADHNARKAKAGKKARSTAKGGKRGGGRNRPGRGKTRRSAARRR